jgi:hypothetical protein
VAVANARGSKRDIDRAKKEKAALKRDRRQHPDGGSSDSTATEALAETSLTSKSEGELLEALDRLHGRFDAGKAGFAQFEADKADLLAQLADR